MGYPEAAWILNELTEQNTSTQNLIKTRREASLTGEGATVYENNTQMVFDKITVSYMCMLGKFIAPVDGIYKVTIQTSASRNYFITAVPCIYYYDSDAGYVPQEFPETAYNIEIGGIGTASSDVNKYNSASFYRFPKQKGHWAIEYQTNSVYSGNCVLRAGEKAVIGFFSENRDNIATINSVKVTYQPLIDE